MEKNYNILIANFTEKLDAILQHSNLPVGIIYFILKDYTNKIEQQYIGYVNSYMWNHPVEETVNLANEEQEEDNNNSSIGQD